jgi:transposase
MTIIRIGLDTSKHVFQVHGVDEEQKPVLRRQLRRGEVEKVSPIVAIWLQAPSVRS